MMRNERGKNKMKIGNRIFDFEQKAYIMGILNVTPDSFSDGGKFNRFDEGLRQAEQLIQDGADILDIGGESTRPGYTFLSAQEELERVLPMIEAIKQRFDIPISLDTYKSEVAKEGIKAGVDLINDIWGLRWDGSMAEVVAKSNIPVCIMHNRKEQNYQNFLSDVLDDLRESIKIAKEAGIRDEHIILDPGIGFAKSLEQNLYLMNHMEALLELSYPVLLGTSRKSMIGLTLNLPVDEREEGTIVTTVLGYEKGCRIFRVHDVKKNKRALEMLEAIVKAK